MSSEYMGNLTLNRSQMLQALKAQQAVMKAFEPSALENVVEAILTPASSVLGLIFCKSTPYGVASSLISLATSDLFSTRETLQKLAKNGYDFLNEVAQTFLESDPEYDMVQIEVPYLYDSDRGIRFIQGNGGILKVHVKGGSGWVIWN